MLLTCNHPITLAMGAQLEQSRLTTQLLNKTEKGMVYVLNQEGNPLMPTIRHGKVRRMLRTGLAHVVRCYPFTIQLNYESSSYKQAVTLGVDAGVTHIGLSASTSKAEVFSAEVVLREDIRKKISLRKMYRRNRRYRKTRYRKPRWKCRRHSKFTPSVRYRIDRHLHVIRLLHAILPVTKTIIETGKFDIVRIKNPNVENSEYFHGPLENFWNVREYVLWRDGHKCCYCKGKSGDKILNVHHIESRQTGGDSPGNLITLCRTCHNALHRGDIRLNRRRNKPLRDYTQMNIMRKAIISEARELFPNVYNTYGYITKKLRIANGIEKSHSADAFCIAGNMKAERMDSYFLFRCVPRHTRTLHFFAFRKGGVRYKAITSRFIGRDLRLQRNDAVMWKGIRCFISGSSGGKVVLKDINWKIVTPSAYVSPRSVKFLRRLHGGMLMAQMPQRIDNDH